ncbi:MAG: sigma-70 family RNA polymerase sigma factor [Candidatus Micrarchaeia archaeon]
MRKLSAIPPGKSGSSPRNRKKFIKGKQEPAPICRSNEDAWKLVMKNIGLLNSIMEKHSFYKKFSRDKWDDIEHLVLLTMFHTAQRYDETRNIAFSTYLFSNMPMCIRDIIHFFSIHNISQRMRGSAFRALVESEQEQGVSPYEIVDRMESGPKTKNSIKRAIEVLQMEKTKIDEGNLFYASGELAEGTKWGGAGQTLDGDNRDQTPESEAFNSEVRRKIEEALGVLDEREKRAIVQRMGLDGKAPRTFQEIGEPMGVSRESARHFLKNAIEKIARSEHAGALRACWQDM